MENSKKINEKSTMKILGETKKIEEKEKLMMNKISKSKKKRLHLD